MKNTHRELDAHIHTHIHISVTRRDVYISTLAIHTHICVTLENENTVGC